MLYGIIIESIFVIIGVSIRQQTGNLFKTIEILYAKLEKEIVQVILISRIPLKFVNNDAIDSFASKNFFLPSCSSSIQQAWRSLHL